MNLLNIISKAYNYISLRLLGNSVSRWIINNCEQILKIYLNVKSFISTRMFCYKSELFSIANSQIFCLWNQILVTGKTEMRKIFLSNIKASLLSKSQRISQTLTVTWSIIYKTCLLEHYFLLWLRICECAYNVSNHSNYS